MLNIKKLSISTIFPIIILLTLLSFGILIPILSVVALGAILAYYVRPIAKRIKPFVKYETLAIIIGMIILAAPIIALLYVTAVQILAAAIQVFGSIPHSSASATSTATATALNIKSGLATAQNSDSLNSLANLFISNITAIAEKLISYLVNQIITLLEFLPTLAMQILILLFSTFYFAKDGDKVILYIKDIVPAEDKGFYRRIIHSTDDIMKSIVVGNVIPAIILGLLSMVLYYFLGYPYILLLGILSGLSEFIPIVGPWIVYGVLGLFSILTGDVTTGVLVIFFGWIIETTTDMYIRPKLSVNYSEVHPLVFLLGFIFGAVTLGIPGLFIGPLILGVTYSAYLAYREEVKDTG